MVSAQWEEVYTIDRLIAMAAVVALTVSGISFFECYISTQHNCPTSMDIPPQNWFPLFVIIAFLFFIVNIQEPMPVTPKTDWPVGGEPECSSAQNARKNSKG